MGFRNLHGFNLAMLGKQGWKFMTDHDAIVSRVFKAKYFPNSDFLGARLGHNPCFVWRSIYASLVVVRAGFSWKVGNGKSINIWKDPWLKNKDNPYPITTPFPGSDSMTVDQLFDQRSRQWNMGLINSIFVPEDALTIRGLPLLCENQDDAPIWKCSRNGYYSVKSAYFEVTEKITKNTELRCPSQWKLLWKLRIPPKIKLLLWRMGRGCLPIRQNLQKKHVPCNNECCFCVDFPESEWHVFFGCIRAQQIWQASKLWQEIQAVTDRSESFISAFFTLLQTLNQEQNAAVAFGYWSIWRQRNANLWNGEELPTRVAVEQTTDFMSEWNSARSRSRSAVGRPTLEIPLTWVKPPAGLIKCNLDAAFFTDDKNYGVGMCARDENGQFVRAISAWFHGIPRVVEAEIKGLECALKWMKELGFSVSTLARGVPLFLFSLSRPLAVHRAVRRASRRSPCLSPFRALCLFSYYFRFVVEKNSLRITTPKSLKGVYECAIGNFGVPQYGGTLVAFVVYPNVNRNGCRNFTDFNTSFLSNRGGVSTFLLVDRGSKGPNFVKCLRF